MEPNLELVRIQILHRLNEHASSWCTECLLHLDLNTNLPRKIDDAVIRAELIYLQDKGLVVPVPKLISLGASKRWRITAAGRDYLELEGGR